MADRIDRNAGTVLIVEDDAVQRRVLQAMLSKLGRPSIAAASLGEARARLEDADVTTVVLDLRLGDEAGLDLLAALGGTAAPRTLVLTSGCDERTLAATLKLAAACGVRVAGSLAKPVDEPALAKLLQAPVPEAAPAPRGEARRVTAQELELALDEDCIHAEFQPKISLATGRPLGVEALARWRSPLHGTIAPDAFIAIAEASGEMPRLTERMLAVSMAACARWRRRYSALSLAVNVPPSVIGARLLTTVTGLLARFGLPPSSLVLEITESCLLSDSLETAEVLTRLRIHGVQLSIDDFGTGYSSLVSLLKIPFNEIKLDRLFVSNALRDPDADRILRAVIAMSHDMGLHCVAEGIDSVAVRDRLLQYGCDAGQGWLWSKAMGEAELLAWLDNVDAAETPALHGHAD